MKDLQLPQKNPIISKNDILKLKNLEVYGLVQNILRKPLFYACLFYFYKNYSSNFPKMRHVLMLKTWLFSKKMLQM